MKPTISMIDGHKRIYLFKCESADPIGADHFKHIKVQKDGFILAPSRIVEAGWGRRFVAERAPGKIGLGPLSAVFRTHTGKKSNVPAMKVGRVRIAGILVDDNRRKLRQPAVQRKKESMALIGMKTPITVSQADDGIHLVTGLHRLEAAKALGCWIDAAFFEGDETEARMWQLLENLDHLDLTALERAEDTAELIRDTAQRISRQNVGKKRGRPESVTAKAARGLPIGGATADAREKTAERAFKIADLAAEAKAEAKTCGLDDSQSALLEVANEPTLETQLAKVREIKGRTKKQSKRSHVKKGAGAKVDAEEASRPDRCHPDDGAARGKDKRQVKGKPAIPNAPPTPDKAGMPLAGSAPAHPPEDAAQSPSSAPTRFGDIPAYVDQRPLSAQNKKDLADVMAEWDEAKELKIALAKSSKVVHERFLGEVRRWLGGLHAKPGAGLH